MKQKTLVAFYKRKSATLIYLVAGIIKLLRDSPLRTAFTPYELDQIHGTLIGMEYYEESGVHYNLNLWKREQIKVPVLKEKLGLTLDSKFPLTIQFGGYPEEYREFQSQDKNPFERSFVIDLINRQVVLIGWPVRSPSNKGDALWSLRSALHENCNLAHKYHNDNDFYMVLGDLSAKADKIKVEQISAFEEKVRTYLSGKPVEVQVRKRDMSIANYSDSRLPLESTDTITIEDFLT